MPVVNLTFKYKVYVSPEDDAYLRTLMLRQGSIYNMALRYRIHEWEHDKIAINYAVLSRMFTTIKPSRPEYASLPDHMARAPFKIIELAYNAAFRRVKEGLPPGEEAGFPKPKRERDFTSIVFPDCSGWRLRYESGRWGYLTLGITRAKMGGDRTIKVRMHRPYQGDLKNCVLKLDGDEWYVTFAAELTTEEYIAPYTACAINLGIVYYAGVVDSEGREYLIPNPSPLIKQQTKLAALQQELSHHQGPPIRIKLKKGEPTAPKELSEAQHEVAAAYPTASVSPTARLEQLITGQRKGLATMQKQMDNSSSIVERKKIARRMRDARAVIDRASAELEAVRIDTSITTKPARHSSYRWQQISAAIRNLHKTIRHTREHHLHVLSRDLANNYRTIILEERNVKAMTARPAPIPDEERSTQTGTTVYSPNGAELKSKLNKRILDASWSKLKGFIQYKQEANGGQTILINPAYASQDCWVCGNRQKLKAGVRTYHCTSCGYTADVDINAAHHDMQQGLALMANQVIKSPRPKAKRNRKLATTPEELAPATQA